MKPLVIVDGKCVLCDGVARFLGGIDRTGELRFTTLQGETADRLGAAGVIDRSIDTVFYVRGGRGYIKSQAVLELASDLGFPWSALRVFQLVPVGWRDGLYDFIASRRFRWFGEKATCGLPKDTLKERVLP